MSFAGGNEAVVEKYFVIQWGEFPVRWQLDFNWTSDQTRKAPFYLLPGRVGLVSKGCGDSEQLLHIKYLFGLILQMIKDISIKIRHGLLLSDLEL